MKAYQKILLPSDFSRHSKSAALRACELAKFYQAHLSLLHVVEYYPEDIPVEIVRPENIDMDAYLEKRARKSLDEIATSLAYPDTSAVVILSAHGAKHEISAYAKAQDIDLIIIGSHGRHGLSSLLGSTAEGVLHRVACDVLTVSLDD